MHNGNVSKEYIEQRVKDSPLHRLKTAKTCTVPIQNPSLTTVEGSDPHDTTTDRRESD